MKRVALFTSILIAMATSATAETLVVRSGEHDSHTRLVVKVPPGTEWVLARRKNGARLTVSIDDVLFQTEGVFGRLTSNRLSALSQSKPGSALDLEFGCDCVATAFLYQQSMIVVDISQGTLPPPLTANIPLPPSLPPLEVEDPLEPLALPLLTLNQQGFKDQLSARLLQGADREVLDLDLAAIGPRASTLPSDADMLPSFAANMNVSTIVDELEGLLGPDIPQIEKRPACISSARLGFDTWSDARPFDKQIADLRSGLYQEFDRVDTDLAFKLAKLYAYFGFGAEAVSTLELVEDHSEEKNWVHAIAGLVDYREPAEDSPFRGLQRCSSDAAFWSVLSEQTLSPDADLNAIEQSFYSLPQHLRRSLGPRLSSILVEADKLEAARRVMRSVDRVETEEQPSVAKAQIAQAEGDSEVADTILEEVISTPETSTDAPLALARLIEKRWAERGAVSPQNVALAAAYALEFRGSETGPMMQHAHIVALSLNNEFDTSYDLIQALPEGDDRTDVLNRHTHLLEERSNDVTFLKQVLSMSDSDSMALTTQAAIAVSDRLGALGFAAQSSAFANRTYDTTDRSQRARLRARAALLDEKPHKAMLELSDDASTAADTLRAQALAAIGDQAATAELYRELGETEVANRYFWLAGLSEKIELEGRFANLSEISDKLALLPRRLLKTPLADANSLLTDSEETRARIADLFALIPDPEVAFDERTDPNQ
ncbi:hypothetical protein [Ruegeria profundi]|uniref:hypothetical protein n=1 Tax=Ruegeria profundi TaxID=1685378 RepID=UPI003C7E56A9